MMDKETIEREIEEKRKKIVKSAQIYGLTAENTLKDSQELDRLIILYMRQFSNLNKKQKLPANYFNFFNAGK